MLRSYILRLVDGALANGEVVGHVEVVESGETKAVRNLEELLGVFGVAPTAPVEERS